MKTAIKSKKRISQATKVVKLSNQQVSEICAMLNWTDQQYYDHQYEEYEQFLKRALFSARIEVYNTVRYSPLMRGLWNNEWIVRNIENFLPFGREFNFSGVAEYENEELVLYLPMDTTLSTLIDEYEFIHNGKRLYSDQSFMIKYHHVLTLISKS